MEHTQEREIRTTEYYATTTTTSSAVKDEGDDNDNVMSSSNRRARRSSGAVVVIGQRRQFFMVLLSLLLLSSLPNKNGAGLCWSVSGFTATPVGTTSSGSGSGSRQYAKAAAIRITTQRGGSRSTSSSCCLSSSRLFSAATTTTKTKSINTLLQRKQKLAFGMAVLTGYADVLLVQRYQTFATMLTGNMLWLANSIIQRQITTFTYYSSVIISYLLGVLWFRTMDRTVRQRTLRRCAWIVMVLLIGADIVTITQSSRWLPMSFLSCAFGIVNSIGAEVAGTLTFVVTGHLTKYTHYQTDRVSLNLRQARRARRRRRRKNKGVLNPDEKDNDDVDDGSSSDDDDDAAVRQQLDLQYDALQENKAVIGGFFVGALLSSLLESFRPRQFGVFSVLGFLYGILFYSVDMERLGGAWWLRTDGQMCELDDDGEMCVFPDDDDDDGEVVTMTTASSSTSMEDDSNDDDRAASPSST